MRTRQAAREETRARALDHSALLELIEVLRTADSGNLMRSLLAVMLQALIAPSNRRRPHSRTAPNHENADAISTATVEP